MREYVGAQLDTKKPSKNLHKNKRLIKDCFDRNNARNRDSFSVTSANGMMKGEKAIQPFTNRSTDTNETEDAIIEAIDSTLKKS